jgi:hypothetical protein
MLTCGADLDIICSIAVQVLEQKDEIEEALEDKAEYDSVFISSAGNLVSSLANALGNGFAQAFGTFFPLISKYYVSLCFFFAHVRVLTVLRL